MTRRSIVLLTLPLLLFGLIVFLPGAPPVRSWVVERTLALDGIDATVSFAGTTGNLWRSVTLEEPTLTTPSGSLAARTLSLRWSIVGARTGRLPVWIAVTDLSADLAPTEGGVPVDLDRFVWPHRIDLQALRLSGDRIHIGNRGVELATDVSIEALRLGGDGDRMTGSLDLVTLAGRVPLDVHADLAAPSLHLVASNTDAAAFDPFWPGTAVGRASGSLAWSQETGLSGSAVLERAEAHVRVGDGTLTATGVEGSLTLEGATLRGAFSGELLGGSVTVNGNVDLASRSVDAAVAATTDLAATLEAFVPGSWDPGSQAAAGALAVELTLDGNVGDASSLRAGGTARVSGQLADRPLDVTIERLALGPERSLDVNASGTALGGSLTVRSSVLEPDVVEFALTDVRIGSGVEAELQGGIDLARRELAASLRAANATATAPLLVADVQGGVTEGGVHAAWTGALAGAPLEGTARWMEERLTASAAWNLGAEGASGPAASAAIEGPLEALSLALVIDGPEPWGPRRAGLSVDADLRGSVRGLLQNGRIDALDGRLGPLTIRGNLDLRGLDPTAKAQVDLAPVTVRSGMTATTITLSSADLVLTRAAPSASPAGATRLAAHLLSPQLTVSATTRGIEARAEGLDTPLQWGDATVPGRLSGGFALGEDGLEPSTLTWTPLEPSLHGAAPIEVRATRDESGTALRVRRGAAEANRSNGSWTFRTRGDGDLGTVWPTLGGVQGQGVLRYDPATANGPWTGALTLDHATWGTARIGTPAGDLLVDAQLLPSLLPSRLSGRLWPEVRLEAETSNELGLRAAVQATASPSDLVDTLRIVGWAEMPTSTSNVSFAPSTTLHLEADATRAVVTGPQDDRLVVDASGIAGAIAVPVRLAEQPTWLTIRGLELDTGRGVDLQIDGMDGRLRIERDASTQTIRTEARLPADLLPGLAARVLPRGADATLVLANDGTWSVSVEADVASAARDGRIAVAGSGRGRRGEAAWALEAGGLQRALIGRAEVDGTRLRVATALETWDLAAIGEAIGVRLDGSGSGTAAWEIDLATRGAATYVGDARVELDVAGTEVLIDGTEVPGTVRVRRAPTFDATVRLPSEGTRSANLVGVLGGEPLTGTIQMTSTLGVELAASWRDVQGSLTWRTVPGGWTGTLDAQVPGQADEEPLGAASLVLAGNANGVQIERADLTMRGAPALQASVGGRLWPTVEVAGTLAVGGLSEGEGVPVELVLRGAWDRLAAAAIVDTLRVDAALTDLRVDALTLSGERATVFGVAIEPSTSGLRWSTSAGWEGSATVRSAKEDGSEPRAEATLEGREEALEVEASSLVVGSIGSLQIDLAARAVGAPWSPAWQGTGTLSAELGADQGTSNTTAARAVEPSSITARAVGPSSIRARADLALSGDGIVPTLTGEGRVDGPNPGTLTLASEGTAAWLRADLESATLDLRAQPGAIDATFTATGWDLGGWNELPFDLQLDGSATVRGTPNGIEGRLEDLELRGAGGRLTGEGTVSGSDVLVQLRNRLDLDVMTGGAVDGTVDGPVTLQIGLDRPTEVRINTDLSLRDGHWAGGVWSGALNVEGPLFAPRTSLRLTGSDAWSGALHAAWEPATGFGAVTSTLTGPTPLGVLTTDLSAISDGSGLDGSGSVEVGAQRWSVSSQENAVRFALDGSDEGEAVVDLDGSRVPQLRARIPVLPRAGAYAGHLDIEVGVRTDAPWLRAHSAPLRVAGTELPALRAEARGLRLRVADAGSGVPIAELDLAGGAWTLAASDLPVQLVGGANGRVAVEASGFGLQGNGTVALMTEDGTVDLTASVERTERLSMRVAGALLGGSLDADLLREAGAWNGSANLRDAMTPWARGDVTVRVAGSERLPDLRATLDLEGALPVRGAVQVLMEQEGPIAELGLTLELAGAPVGVTGRAWPNLDLTVQAAETSSRLYAPSWTGPAPWRVEGEATTMVAGIALALHGGAQGEPTLRATIPATPATTIRLPLGLRAPLESVTELASRGAVAQLEGAARGTLRLGPGFRAEIGDARWSSAVGAFDVAGTVDRNEVDLTATFLPDLSSEATLAARALRDLTGPLGAVITTEGSLDRFDAHLLPNVQDGEAPAGTLAGMLRWDGITQSATVNASAAGVHLDAVLAPNTGLQGVLVLDRVAIDLPGEVATTLDGRVEASGANVRGAVRSSGVGRASLEGVVDLSPLLPARWRPAEPGEETNASLRLAAVDVTALPLLARELPHLGGEVSGLAEFRGSRVLAQLTAPELRLGTYLLPLRLEGAGDLSRAGEGLLVGGTWGGAPVQGSVTLEGANLLLSLEQFPLPAPIEARVGPVASRGEVTGVARLDFPWREPDGRSIRVATEQVVLRNDGVVTQGTVALAVDPAGSTIDARFEGAGDWSLQATTDEGWLEARLDVQRADAAPLLGLVPTFSRFDAGAVGSLDLTAVGPLDAPQLHARDVDVAFDLLGSSVQLRAGRADLIDGRLTVAATIQGTAPLGGALGVVGSARVNTADWSYSDVALDVTGTAQIPLAGTLEEVAGRIEDNEEGRLTLELTGTMGAPVRIEGSLWPLDVRTVGNGVRLTAPRVFVEEATADVDLVLRLEEVLHLSGSIAGQEGRLTTERGAPPGPARETPDAQRGREAFVFDGVRVTSPQMTFDTSFGRGALDVDLVLGGSVAHPTLDGAGTLTSGTLTISGREFTIREGALRFDPTRGVYPRLEVDAVTTFEKRGVLAGATVPASLPQPPGSTFDVTLRFDAEATPAADSRRGFALDLDPVLASDAILAIPGSATRAPVTRELSEAELTSLVTLRRLDVSGELLGGSAAGSVASGALDSAIEGLLLSEVQRAFAEALGVDVLEIRTTPFSQLVRGDDDPFGVSLRLGGYVGEGLFASYEVGRFVDDDASQPFRNTLSVRYQLGPVGFDVSTTLDLGVDTALPRSRVAAALRYDLTPWASLETGASFGGEEGEARFGVTLRW